MLSLLFFKRMTLGLFHSSCGPTMLFPGTQTIYSQISFSMLSFPLRNALETLNSQDVDYLSCIFTSHGWHSGQSHGWPKGWSLTTLLQVRVLFCCPPLAAHKCSCSNKSLVFFPPVSMHNCQEGGGNWRVIYDRARVALSEHTLQFHSHPSWLGRGRTKDAQTHHHNFKKWPATQPTNKEAACEAKQPQGSMGGRRRKRRRRGSTGRLGLARKYGRQIAGWSSKLLPFLQHSRHSTVKLKAQRRLIINYRFHNNH